MPVVCYQWFMQRLILSISKPSIRQRSSSFLACNSRLHSTIRRHHPPQRAVLSQICCFGECKVALFQILFDGVEPRDAGMTYLSMLLCILCCLCSKLYVKIITANNQFGAYYNSFYLLFVFLGRILHCVQKQTPIFVF